MLITVPEEVVPNWVDGPNGKLRVTLTRTITTGTGESRIKSTRTSFYRDVDCVVDENANTITIPEITLDSTTDSSDAEAEYVCFLYDGSTKITMFAKVKVPHFSGDTISWGQLRNYNSTSPPFTTNNVYTKTQTDIAIQEAIDQIGSSGGGIDESTAIAFAIIFG